MRQSSSTWPQAKNSPANCQSVFTQKKAEAQIKPKRRKSERKQKNEIDKKINPYALGSPSPYLSCYSSLPTRPVPWPFSN